MFRTIAVHIWEALDGDSDQGSREGQERAD